jgi:hypothetical protein
MFMQALTTGFRDVEMRIKVQELTTKKCTEVELMAEVKALEAQTRDRVAKSGQASCSHVKMAEERESAASSTMERLTGVMEQLVARIEVLERREKNERDQQTRSRFKCRACIENKIQRCKHCWRCGSGAHFERNCDKKNQNQGNDNVSR